MIQSALCAEEWHSALPFLKPSTVRVFVDHKGYRMPSITLMYEVDFMLRSKNTNSGFSRSEKQPQTITLPLTWWQGKINEASSVSHTTSGQARVDRWRWSASNRSRRSCATRRWRGEAAFRPTLLQWLRFQLLAGRCIVSRLDSADGYQRWCRVLF